MGARASPFLHAPPTAAPGHSRGWATHFTPAGPGPPSPSCLQVDPSSPSAISLSHWFPCWAPNLLPQAEPRTDRRTDGREEGRAETFISETLHLRVSECLQCPREQAHAAPGGRARGKLPWTPEGLSVERGEPSAGKVQRTDLFTELQSGTDPHDATSSSLPSPCTLPPRGQGQV